MEATITWVQVHWPLCVSDPDSSLRAFLLLLVQATLSFLLILPWRASAGGVRVSPQTSQSREELSRAKKRLEMLQSPSDPDGRLAAMLALSSPSQGTLIPGWPLVPLPLGNGFLWADTAPWAYEVGSARHLCTNSSLSSRLTQPSAKGHVLARRGELCVSPCLSPRLGTFWRCTNLITARVMLLDLSTPSAILEGCPSSRIHQFLFSLWGPVLVPLSSRTSSSHPQSSPPHLLLFSHSVVSDSLWPLGQQNARLSCPSQSPRVCSNSCPLNQWCHPTISSSVIPFSSYLQSFPASSSFPMSRLFSSGGQSTGASASASVLPMIIQGWFHLGLIGLVSLLSKGLSRVFSSTSSKASIF